MNLYEISVVDGKGITHKSKVYEINVDAAFKEAFIQGRICGAEKLDDCTVRQIQTNAGVSKDTEREYLGRIKNILDALGPNSYCAMAFEGCVGDAEENIDNDFAVSMKGRWQTECKAHENIRKSLTEKVNAQGQRIAELEAEEKSLAAEYEKTEQGVYLCEVFVKTKVALLTERINSKFKSVSFQLFREQTNGGVADCCEVLVPGEGGAMVPYSTANKAAVVNAGLEIIATLSHHYGVRLPIVVDNAESVTELLPVDSQVIRLVVSAEDESLRVEVDK